MASFTPVEPPYCAQFRKLGLILGFLKIAALFYQKCGAGQLHLAELPSCLGESGAISRAKASLSQCWRLQLISNCVSVQRFLKFVRCGFYILRRNYYFLFWGGQKLIIMADLLMSDVTAGVVTFMLQVHVTHSHPHTHTDTHSHLQFQASLRMNGCVVVFFFHS